MAYRNGLIHFSAHTTGLAGVNANPAAYCREGIFLPDKVQCLTVFSLRNKRNIALDADMSRTGDGTWRSPSFAYCQGVGDGLRITLVNRFALGKALLKLAGQLHRAYINTVTAGAAFCQVDKPRSFQYPCLEIALFSL